MPLLAQPIPSSGLQTNSGSLKGVSFNQAQPVNVNQALSTGGLQRGNVSPPVNNPTSANQQFVNNAQTQANQFSAQTQALLQQQNALLRQQATPAPVLNYGSILANAQAQQTNPNSAVNQLYQSQLNNYLQNEAAQQKIAQSQNQLSVQNAQQQLANTQAQLGQQQTFTGQQTAQDIGNIANQQKYYEQQQGIASEQNLNALRQQQGQGGLAGSGIAGQQEFMQNLGRQIQENQQNNQYAYQRNSDLLSEANTFADIAQSGKYAQQEESGQEGQANINLSEFLQQAAYAENQTRMSLGQWQQQAQMAAASNAAAQQVQQFIQSYQNNPLLYSKAMQAYSGLTGAQQQPELPNLQSVNA